MNGKYYLKNIVTNQITLIDTNELNENNVQKYINKINSK